MSTKPTIAPSRSIVAFERGLLVGVIAGFIAVAALLTLVVPPNELRSRLWFLLDAPGDPSFHLFVFALFAALGLITLALLRAWHRWSVVGVLAGAALQLWGLSEQLYHWIPEFHSLPVRFAALVFALLAAALLLWPLRARGGRRLAEPAPSAEVSEVDRLVHEQLHTPPTVPWARRDHDHTA
jgi:hypothetical protein